MRLNILGQVWRPNNELSDKLCRTTRIVGFHLAAWIVAYIQYGYKMPLAPSNLLSAASAIPANYRY